MNTNPKCKRGKHVKIRLRPRSRFGLVCFEAKPSEGGNIEMQRMGPRPAWRSAAICRAWIHAGRVTGGHFDHRHPHRSVAAGRSAVELPVVRVFEQPEANRPPLPTYEAMNKTFPAGGLYGPGGGYGFSWLVRIMPQLDETTYYQQSIGRGPISAVVSVGSARIQRTPRYWATSNSPCSSVPRVPLPHLVLNTGGWTVNAPSTMYAGNSGAAHEMTSARQTRFRLLPAGSRSAAC